MRIALIGGIIAAIIIIIVGVAYNTDKPTIQKEIVKDVINARIEVTNSVKEPEFIDEFQIGNITLSELSIMIVNKNARTPLDVFNELEDSTIIVSIKSSDESKQYELLFGDYSRELENKGNGIFVRELENELPYKLVIKDGDNRELTIKPLLKEVINGKIYYYELRWASINDRTLLVEIADTNEKRALGLMYRDYLPEDAGMFFILDREARTSFWMKNMLISLDMIWINSDGKIVHITKNAQPCKDDIEACTYQPDEPAKYVLEVNAGYTDKYNIKEGDYVELKHLTKIIV